MIKQSSLQKFQEEMGKVQKDPYRVVMRQTKLPMSLLHDRVKAHVSIKGINLLLLYCNVLYFLSYAFCMMPFVIERLSRGDVHCMCKFTNVIHFMSILVKVKLLTSFLGLYLVTQMRIIPLFSSVACFLGFYDEK